MAADPAFLAQISLFQQLDDDERGVLAQVMAEKQVAPGETLFRAGEPGDAMFVVHSGKVELFVKDKAGQKIVLHTAEAGEFFGELSLLDGGSRTATAQVTDAGTLFMIDREDLQQLFRKRPDAALDMLAAMGRMTRKANSLLQARVSRNVNEQVQEERDNIVLRVADWVANFSGSITFLVVHVFFFTAWISFNATAMAFDPFPYNLLTMTVSLEAIILSTLLLFSSNRQGARDRIRADIEYEINLKAELEVAHLHEKTDRIHEEMLDRFARLEKLVAPNGRVTGPHKTAPVPVVAAVAPVAPVDGG
jgi:CRP/FNR family transcriptional regulator, cyclic AMP receptor protein